MEQGNKTKIRRLSSEYMEKQALLEEQTKRRRKGLLRRLSMFASCAILFLSIAGFTLYQQQTSIENQKIQTQQLEEELAYMKHEESRLKQEVDWLHDDEYIAELARRDFFLTKPGETLFQLPRPGNNSN
ncbi:FtsB family cell division protein [Salipaludibacillus daqingensis]|uniref:FtsB family cell division protein n=1 Tax=Salipaludibacillus daqingensis TaxID=3041001 RepID=UPI0024734CEB|nr:septum formation initiator family protein [Salipaludibacillus daqingensis]